MNIMEQVLKARRRQRAARLKGIKQALGQAPDDRPTVQTQTKAVTADGREVEITEERPAHAHEIGAAEREKLMESVGRHRDNGPAAQAAAAREQARQDRLPEDVSAEDFADAFSQQLKQLRKRRRGLRFAGMKRRKIAPNVHIYSNS